MILKLLITMFLAQALNNIKAMFICMLRDKGATTKNVILWLVPTANPCSERLHYWLSIANKKCVKFLWLSLASLGA